VTDVERVIGQYGFGRRTFGEAERYAAAGHFGEGSMRPKIEAFLPLVKSRPSGRGVISNAESIARALRG